LLRCADGQESPGIHIMRNTHNTSQNLVITIVAGWLSYSQRQ
jgi:hypothetical protein